MANEQERLVKVTGKKTAGKTQFWIGIVFFIIGIVLGAITPSYGYEDFDLTLALITGWAAVIAFGISSLFFLVGAILFFKGKSQAKKQKNQIPLQFKDR